MGHTAQYLLEIELPNLRGTPLGAGNRWPEGLWRAWGYQLIIQVRWGVWLGRHICYTITQVS